MTKHSQILELCLKISDTGEAYAKFSYSPHVEWIEIRVLKPKDKMESHPDFDHNHSMPDCGSAIRSDINDEEKLAAIISKLKAFYDEITAGKHSQDSR